MFIPLVAASEKGSSLERIFLKNMQLIRERRAKFSFRKKILRELQN